MNPEQSVADTFAQIMRERTGSLWELAGSPAPATDGQLGTITAPADRKPVGNLTTGRDEYAVEGSG